MITLTSWRRVKCITCISFASCRPAPCSQRWGCGQWVGLDDKGRKCRAPEYPKIEMDDGPVQENQGESASAGSPFFVYLHIRHEPGFVPGPCLFNPRFRIGITILDT